MVILLAQIALTVTVSVSTWYTPQPRHGAGLLVNYGADWLVHAQAQYRGYDMALTRDDCGIATMSPAHLGQVAWVRVAGGDWYGPCVVVDVSRRVDFARYVYEMGEIAEIPWDVAEYLGFVYGAPGELYLGRCQPHATGTPQVYAPPLVVDEPPLERNPLYSAWPAQETPGTAAECWPEWERMARQ